MACVVAPVLISAAALATAASVTPPIPAVTIAPGVHMPALNLGTWQIGNGKPSDPSVGIGPWFAAGGTGLDCAWDYFNQANVAKAVAASGKSRSEIFILTKVPGIGDAYNYVKTDLKQLGIPQADLVLLHAPLDIDNQWKGLERALADNLTRAIGVSNFNAKQLEELAKTATVTPAVNQCEMGVNDHDDETISYCQQHNITYEAWGVIKNCPFNSSVTKQIATTHNVSVAQVCLRYVIDRGCIAAVGTGTTSAQAKEYSEEDIEIFKFRLSPSEMVQLSNIHKSTDTLSKKDATEKKSITGKNCCGTSGLIHIECCDGGGVECCNV